MTTTGHAEQQLHLARRVEDILSSSISRINTRAEELAGQGRDILRLDAGEPDFATPDYIVAAAKQAVEAALNGGLDSVRRMAKQFGERAQAVERGLASIKQIDCLPAQGSFYCFPDFSRIIASRNDVADDQQLGDWLLDELGIAMVPGSGFGAPGYMRLSFAADSETIDEGMRRLQQAFS